MWRPAPSPSPSPSDGSPTVTTTNVTVTTRLGRCALALSYADGPSGVRPGLPQGPSHPIFVNGSNARPHHSFFLVYIHFHVRRWR